jgi:hypothetical protein
MNTGSQDNEHSPSRQAEANMIIKRRAFLKALDGVGVSAARALELWQQADHQGEPEALIRQAIETMYRDNSEAVHKAKEPGVSGDGQRPPVTQEQQPHGDFDVPEPDSRSTKHAAHACFMGEEIGLDETHPFDSDAENDNSENWADVEKAEAEEPDNFPIDALPLAIKTPVKDWMRHLKMPALLPVMCALGALSVALGRGVKALSNVGKTFANIFALMGAESGTGKSLVYDAAMEPLVGIQKELVKASKDINAGLMAELAMVKVSIGALQKNYKDTQMGKVSLTDKEKENAKGKLAALYKEQADLEDKLKHTCRVWTSDFTSEALGGLLEHNNEVIGVCSDEGGIALYNMLGRYTEGNVTDDILLCKCFSVNSHPIDRIGRGQILLEAPCVALLLIVQPDLLQMAFSHTRLLLGGYLARCFSADTELQPMEETDETAAPFDVGIQASWNTFITAVYKKYHDATEPFDIPVNEEVRKLSRKLHNTIVWRVRGRLADIRSFAARWVEQTWKVAILVHVGSYGTDCEKHDLSPGAFEAATAITRYFVTEQLEVLQFVRVDKVEKMHSRLQELFLRHGNEPITMRTLTRSHKLAKSDIISCVKTYSHIYGVLEKKSDHGGEPSVVVYLQKSRTTKMASSPA